MQKLAVGTPLGTVPVFLNARGHRPVVLVIRGAFAEKNDREWLAPEGADVAFLHLPGCHSPHLAETSIEAFIAAFDEVISRLFSGRPITALGVSTGALVAAGLQSHEIRSRVLVEPFSATAHLWALHEVIRAALPTANELYREWAWSILGISADRIENRDYGTAFRPQPGVFAVLGDEPLLPRRPMRYLPSLTSEEDRERLRAAGAIVRVVAGGHDLPGAAIAEAVQDALNSGADEERDDHAVAAERVG